jgi:hypothetical protein
MAKVEPLHDDDVLEYAKMKRVELIESMIDFDTGELPTEAKDRAIFLQALDGLDRVAVAKKRIAGDNVNANKMAEAAAMVSAVLSQVGNQNIFRADAPRTVMDTPVQVYAPDLKLKPGELDIGIESNTYDEFAKRMRPE